MTKAEYLSQLEQKLRGLPQNEINDALDYYDGYLSDAQEYEDGAIENLGSPAEAAAQILADYVVKNPRPASRKSGIGTMWSIILAVWAVPVGLPIAIAVVSVAFSLLIVMLSLIVTFGATGAALILAGIVYLITVPFIAASHFASAVLFTGVAFFAAGVGIWLLKAASVISNVGFGFISRFVGKRILKRRS
ncbi:MAG: DUF1700 domain-containing protein [Clostridiales bacterium]|jgi:uncharacterized membrane protein|nr:DUF1700 domain-containing protein [Clostridiales bacterium]